MKIFLHKTWASKFRSISTLLLLLFSTSWADASDALTWQTIHANGPGFAQNDVYFDATRNAIYVASATNGIAVSTDDGVNWKNFQLPPDALGHLPVYSVNSIYANGNAIYAAVPNVGLMVSLDGGNTWKIYTDDLFDYQPSSVYVADNIIYVVSNNGLSYSSDSGKTWKTFQLGSGGTANAVFVTNKIIYLATTLGLYISSDEGKSWQNISIDQGLPSNNINRVYVIGKNIYAATADKGLAVSTDSGKTWKTYNTSAGLGSNIIDSVYAVGNTIYAATTNGLSVSTNAGTTWINYMNAQGLGSNYVTGVTANGNKIYASTTKHEPFGYGGFSVSTDGGTSWKNITVTDQAPGSDMLNTIYIDGTTIYVGTGSDLNQTTDTGFSVTRDNGQTWQTYTTAQGIASNQINGIYASGNTIYLSATGEVSEERPLNGAISVSLDGGNTWTNYSPEGSKLNFFSAFTASSSFIFVGSSSTGLYKSLDGGQSWANVKTFDGTVVTGLASISGTIYLTQHTFCLFTSNNQGRTWDLNTNLPFSARYCRTVYADNQTIYIGDEQTGLYISTDNGDTWTNYTVDQGLASNSIYGIYADRQSIYVATDAGLSVSMNGGTNWISYTTDEGLGSNFTNAVTSANGLVYVATSYGLSVAKISALQDFAANHPDRLSK